MEIIISDKKETNTKDADSKYLARHNSPLDIEIGRSKGSHIYDVNEKEYIDFLMGWCVGNVGWGVEEIRFAIQNSTAPTYVYPEMLYRPWTELGELLASITPSNLEKCYRATGGTEAVEAAMQIAMAYTGRGKFISIEGCYHGNSIATLSIGSSENREQFGNLLPHCYKLNPPLDIKAAERIEKKLKNKDIAAFIMEPVICNLGILIPDGDFMQLIQSLCKKYGTLFVIDEVATGFGRTGKMFASEYFDLKPDILCMGKGISGGYADLAATITTAKIAKSVKSKVNLYSTYGWHPLSVEASLAYLRYLVDRKESLLENVNSMGEFFRMRLNQMDFKYETEVRGLGLAIAVDTGNEKYAEKIRKKCLEERLLVQSDGPNILMFPALNIDEDTAEEGLSVFENCL
jgi:acetylornithine/succinyldiaminopimelate/putrescine aminotransferase